MAVCDGGGEEEAVVEFFSCGEDQKGDVVVEQVVKVHSRSIVAFEGRSTGKVFLKCS